MNSTVESFDFLSIFNYVTSDCPPKLSIDRMVLLESELVSKSIRACLDRVKYGIKDRCSALPKIIISFNDLCSTTGFSTTFITNACYYMMSIAFPVSVYSRKYIIYYNCDNMKLVYDLILSNTSDEGICVDELQQKTGFDEVYIRELLTYMSDTMVIYYVSDMNHVKLSSRSPF